MFKIIIILVGIILSNSISAVARSEVAPSHQFFIGLAPSLAWVSGNKQQTMYLQSDIEKNLYRR